MTPATIAIAIIGLSVAILTAQIIIGLTTGKTKTEQRQARIIKQARAHGRHHVTAAWMDRLASYWSI